MTDSVLHPTATEPQSGTASMVLSVVICAFTTRRWEMLQSAVQSVVEQKPAPYETIVVIDHCGELEEAAIGVFPPMGVRVVTNEGMRGLSGARNTGVTHARGDVIVFLDDDAVAAPGWLAAHAKHYANPDVLGVGGRVIADWEDRAPAWFPTEFGWVVGCSYLGQPTTVSPVRNPIGANMSFRRAVISSVGGFSQSLGRVGATPMGCEETELSIRATAAYPSGSILHDPRSSVRHRVPASRGTWSYFRRRCWEEGRSKARVTGLARTSAVLSSERVYVRKTLAQGVRRNLAEAQRERSWEAVLRASAICVGLAITTAGYGAGQLSRSLRGDEGLVRTG